MFVVVKKYDGIETGIEAGIAEAPEDYVKKIFFTASMIATGLATVLFVFFLNINPICQTCY